MGFAAPLVTQIACEALFPGLPVGVIAQRLGSEQRCLATWSEQKVRADRPRPEKKFLNVETPIQAGLAQEIGDGKRATLDRLSRGRAPARPCTSHFADLKSTHIEPEVLEVCKGLQHGGPLFQFIAPTATLASTFGMQATKGQQFIDVCHDLLLGCSNPASPKVRKSQRQCNNSLCYRTEYSAYIASVLTSLIATCIYAGVNVLE